MNILGVFKQTIRNLPLLICFLSVMILVSCSSESTAPRTYIALGDSVSSGYGLIGYLQYPKGRHTTVLFEKLQYGNHVDEYVNMATSGFTTTMLLEFLHNLDNETLKYFQNAHVITLNIGGNNILTPFLEYLSAMQIISGVDNVRTSTGITLTGA